MNTTLPMKQLRHILRPLHPSKPTTTTTTPHLLHPQKLPFSTIPPNAESTKGDRITNILIQVVDAKPRKPSSPPTPQQLQQRASIAKQYTIGKFQQHNELHHDLACKIRMKRHAIDLLPRKNDVNVGSFAYLKEEALSVSVEEEFMPPYDRPIAVDTPPIPDFDPSIFMEEED